jgi:hypothetical protein
MITSAPWYVPNTVIRHDLQVPTVKEEIRRLSAHYNTRLCTHPNLLAAQLLNPPTHRRLKRHLPVDLPYRFSVQPQSCNTTNYESVLIIILVPHQASTLPPRRVSTVSHSPSPINLTQFCLSITTDCKINKGSCKKYWAVDLSFSCSRNIKLISLYYHK